MKGLSFVELIALLFTGVAGLASGVQAYVSWETRGEVSRAIVFAERIDACSKVIAAVDPFVAETGAEKRNALSTSGASGRYSLPRHFYKTSAGNAAFDAQHGPRVENWRVAVAAFLIVSPKEVAAQAAYFDHVITREIEQGKFMTQAELRSWLVRLESEAEKLRAACRSYL